MRLHLVPNATLSIQFNTKLMETHGWRMELSPGTLCNPFTPIPSWCRR